MKMTPEALQQTISAVSSTAVALLAHRDELRGTLAAVREKAAAADTTDDERAEVVPVERMLVAAIALADVCAEELETLTGEPIDVSGEWAKREG